MNQYCRYCANCVCGDVAYCEIKKKTMSDSAAKHTNKCKTFVLNPIDAFGENTKGYVPRKNNEVENG